MLLHVEYPRILNILKIFKILEVEVLWYKLESYADTEIIRQQFEMGSRKCRG